MKTEWKDCTDPEELFRLKREGWEIEYRNLGQWSGWRGKSWNDVWTFRIRPPQPKMKTITLRKALFKSSGGVYWTAEDSHDNLQEPEFVCWLGEPYTVEVPE